MRGITITRVRLRLKTLDIVLSRLWAPTNSGVVVIKGASGLSDPGDWLLQLVIKVAQAADPGIFLESNSRPPGGGTDGQPRFDKARIFQFDG